MDDSEIPNSAKTTALPAIEMKAIDTILSATGRQILGSRALQSNSLLSFEDLDQFSGFVLYETSLPKFTRDPSNLIVSDLRDRALLYIDDEFIGALSRENVISTLPISANFGSKLSILVENQGRINFHVADDYKGIRGTVRIQTFNDTRATFETLRDWRITGYSFDNYADLEHFSRVSTAEYEVDKSGVLYDGPVVFKGIIDIDNQEEIEDTYWDTKGWGKGFIFINGLNLGRYWPLVGPQITMYIPKEALKHGNNEIQLVELQRVPENAKMNFVNGPIFINDQKV